MLGDDIIVSNVPLTKQLMNNYDEMKSSTLAVILVPHEETSKYSVIEPTPEVSEGIYAANSFFEKPEPEDALSNLAIVMSCLLKPEIFDLLEIKVPDVVVRVSLRMRLIH